MTSMIGGSGAGKIQAQAGEVMSMVFSTLDDKEFEQVISIIESHNEKLEQKKGDGTSYKDPRYKKGQEPILDAGWINSSKAVRAGIVFVNTYRLISPMAPFGGIKDSGYGKEAGIESIKEYTRIKTTWYNSSDKPMTDPFTMG